MNPDLLVSSACAIGESPLWDDDDQILYWTDIPRGNLWALDWRTMNTRRVHLASHLSAVALNDVSGDLVGVAGKRLLRIQSANSTAPECTVLARNVKRDGRFNDAAVDARGRLWVGTSEGVGGMKGSLYRFDVAGIPPARYPMEISMSNGIGWSPDGTVMYFVDTSTSRVDRFDFDLDGGVPSRRRPFIELPGRGGLPDGLCVDSGGDLWLALWGAGQVRRYAVDGALRAAIQLPVPNVTSCCFGGPDLNTLFVTTAANGNDSGPHRLAGSLFAISAIDATGQRSQRLRLHAEKDPVFQSARD